MAVPKSVRERISRKTRLKKSTPQGIDMPGRIVVKKTANNDPNNSELDLEEKKFSEDIAKFYKGGEPIIDEAVIELIDLLIDESINASGSYPLNIERLNEMKELVKSKLVKESINDKPEIELNFKISTRNQATAQGLKDLIHALSNLGNAGCSREVKVYFDGDGHNRFKIIEFSATGAELDDTKTKLDDDVINIDSFG
jgi:hypothetical protein